VPSRPDPDAPLERLLRTSLTSDAVPAGEACLDADAIAAWLAGALPEAEAAGAERHLSRCVRCQAVLAACARMPDDPEMTAIAPRRVDLRWVVPIAASVAALLAWAVWPREPSAPASDVTAVARVAPTVPPLPARTEKDAAPPSESSTPARRVPAPSAAPARPAAEQTTPAPPTATTATGEPAAPDVPVTRPEPPPAPPGAPPAAALPAPSTPVAGGAAERPREADAEPLSRRMAQAQGGERSMALDRVGPIEIVAARTTARNGGPAGRSGIAAAAVAQPARWRIGPSGVEHSKNGGSSWASASIDSAARLRGGSAPGGAVCWVVGDSGAVFRTTNGTSFTRVPFPAAVDLVAVTAADAERATITPADGRVFTTGDAGATWVANSPQ
jgi:hypothetical protein